MRVYVYLYVAAYVCGFFFSVFCCFFFFGFILFFCIILVNKYIAI